MSIFTKLSSIALKVAVEWASKQVGQKIGVTVPGNKIFDCLEDHFKDHSDRLPAALRKANERAWQALEISLAGETLWQRCTSGLLVRGEDRVFSNQVRAFLDSTQSLAPVGNPEFLQKCLKQLRAAREAGMLDDASAKQPASKGTTAKQVSLARYSEPSSLINSETKVMQEMAQVLRPGYPDLAALLEQTSRQGTSILVVGVRYFFRRSIEEDGKLFQGITFSKMEKLEVGFASLNALMIQKGNVLEEMLGDVREVVVGTYSAVLDVQDKLAGHSTDLRQINEAVHLLLEKNQLARREVRHGDSMSVRDSERPIVKQLIARYRALPDEDRRQVPALLNAIGKLEVAAGECDAARKDFQAVAELVKDPAGQAEAHYNAYQAALAKNDWNIALLELMQAVKLDAKRFAPFPVGKYTPIRILGRGGFGVAFLCKHRDMESQVVVKAIIQENQGLDVEQVFSEANLLAKLDHPAIIHIDDFSYVDRATKSRAFLVLRHFNGLTLQDHVKQHGPLSMIDLIAVAKQMAEGLKAAHGKNILHRDIKPANVLIRKEGSEWRVKIIDFGLAMTRKRLKSNPQASTKMGIVTQVGTEIAGTMDYAAPEQMGRLENVEVSPASDVYGFGRTCCYALFETPNPIRRHWQSVKGPMADLLGRCVEDDTKNRPQNFVEVLKDIRLAERDLASSAGGTRSRDASEKSERGGAGWLLWVGGGMAFAAMILVVLTVFVFRSKTKAGTLVVEIEQPGAEVFVDGNRYTITRPGENESIQVEVQEGTRQLKVVKGGFETFTKEFKIRAGEKEIIRVRLDPVVVELKETKTTPKEKIQPSEETKTTPKEKIQPSEETKTTPKEMAPPKEITNNIGMKFSWIPPGKFLMGSPKDEKGRRDDELQHEVSLTKGFYMAIHPVNQAFWQEVMGNNPSQFKGGELPVEQVSWEDSQEFLRKLSNRDGHPYRLPTEAEWEYACRAGTTTPFCFGPMILADQANFDGNVIYGLGRKGVARKKTTSVTSFPANPWGLHDMHGNVWQWCEDWYGEYSINDNIDPRGPKNGERRVLRGGSFDVQASIVRSACRNYFVPTPRQSSHGFRPVRTFSQESKSQDNLTKTEIGQPQEKINNQAKLPPKEITNSIGMKFTWIQPGKFLMGSTKDEKGRKDDETQRQVTLTKGFYLAMHPVNQAFWYEIMGTNPSKFKGGDLPAEQVSWEDCQEFLRKMSKRDGHYYRLPTEAEWEYACRSGTTTSFSFGPTISTDQANYYGKSNVIEGFGKEGVFRNKTTSERTFPANAWGLYDMHGNVWEWCEDWYEEYSKDDNLDPQGPKNGKFRVLRGGSWTDGPSGLRSAYRLRRVPTDRIDNVGFRPAMTFAAE